MLAPNAFLPYLSAAPKYVGATTIEEQAWCRWFAAEIYTGEGAVVELGPWLGSLTTSYCEGLARNPRVVGRQKLAVVYDLVVLRDFGYPDVARRIVTDGALGARQGDGQYDHQLETIRSWGYTDVLPDER